ncbi:DUF6970 domain-containing protein [Fibrella forsythiae]|uniref:DUF6970 domain-containing protein n=1 Tax=Fibrella forsythiae TaxID=2817061 RepID=UPI0035B66A63
MTDRITYSCRTGWVRSALLIGLSCTLSCSTDAIPADTPACIRDQIAQMQAAPVRNPRGSVTQYSYKGRAVYYIPSDCCDGLNVLLDADCTVICAPDGGFSGSGDGRCRDFYQTATDKKLIWQDDRK